MGFFDFIKGLFGGGKKDEPEPPPNEQKMAELRAAWQAAWQSGDFYACLRAAKDLSFYGWLHDESLTALKQLGERFPAERAHCEQEIATTLYLGKAGYREALTDPQKAAIYEEALGHYVRAAQLGDTFGDLNYWEMCEWLSDADGFPKERTIGWLERYKAIYPKGEQREKVDELLEELRSPS